MGIPDYSVYLFPDYTEDRGGITNVSQLGYTMLQYLPGKYNAKPVWNELAAMTLNGEHLDAKGINLNMVKAVVLCLTMSVYWRLPKRITLCSLLKYL